MRAIFLAFGLLVTALPSAPFRLRQRRRDLEADLDSLEVDRAQLAERETLLSTRAKKAESREAEVRRLRRETDEDRAGLDGARQACLDRERALSGMEEALRERESDAVEVEVGVGCGRGGVGEIYLAWCVCLELVYRCSRERLWLENTRNNGGATLGVIKGFKGSSFRALESTTKT